MKMRAAMNSGLFLWDKNLSIIHNCYKLYYVLIIYNIVYIQGGKMEIIDFKNILWNYTRTISENTNLLISSICEQHGLTSLQVRILVEIQQQGSHTIGSLAKKLNMAGTNISTMCKKLESRGLLERVRDEQDERVVKVILSRLGIEIVGEIDDELTEKISESIKGENKETLTEILRGLKKFNELLEKIDKTKK
jgi:MarR family transcriptional regulator, organic hydroperoxide resistance regulator